ncbi:rod shape-determining protein MreD [Sunxiuqinia elliptica]|uniref:Rod shape-determining protein MreD n=1 Tax=Sunxiuqinia elliptica TaxID=655355 RepID=A0A4R6H8T6_9BACT|nr:rod shape-determining protein MreD [Sunxiuqinia elliptica]TDO04712.1 rod shape-determining protein MreD [Sunxiuqinia elliptica]TDO64260.1 rod shape-determining protein MreD [Sunxiuqinia elliptica]
MIRDLLKYTIMLVVLVLLQVLLLNNIQFSGYINPYMYVLFILLLPFETPRYLLLLLGFVLGLLVDIFSNTPGFHASATTFLAFLRPYTISLISPRDTIEVNTPPRLKFMGIGWFLRYTLILVLAHHLFLFFVEAFTFNGFIHTLVRSLLSAAFTSILIIISQFLIFKE